MYQLRLIGYPIKHSLSPWIHEQFLERSHLKGIYKIHEIPSDESFTDHINQLKLEQVNGFNITVPYKVKIMSYLDRLDPETERIGAVNTVVNHNGQWVGYNTDGIGYVRSLESEHPSLKNNRSNTRVMIIGAGGAARGIYDAFLQSGYRLVDIANRTRESADAIAQLNQTGAKTNVKSLQDALNTISHYDVIVQTTSVGMRPHVDEIIIPLQEIKEGTIVSDIVYQPLETKFLKEAKKYGARVVHGHTMLLYQAQYAFELWTGQEVSTAGMADALKNILEG